MSQNLFWRLLVLLWRLLGLLLPLLSIIFTLTVAVARRRGRAGRAWARAGIAASHLENKDVINNRPLIAISPWELPLLSVWEQTSDETWGMGGVNKQFFGRIESVCVFYKYLRSSVIPPRPILVKKLMANLHIIQLRPSQRVSYCEVRPCIPWVVSWQKSLPAHLQCGVPCPRNKFGQAHEFRKLLQCMMTND